MIVFVMTEIIDDEYIAILSVKTDL